MEYDNIILRPRYDRQNPWKMLQNPVHSLKPRRLLLPTHPIRPLQLQ